MQLFGYMQGIYSSSLEVMKFMCNMFSKYIYWGGGGIKKTDKIFDFLKIYLIYLKDIFAIHIEPILISMVCPGQKGS